MVMWYGNCNIANTYIMSQLSLFYIMGKIKIYSLSSFEVYNMELLSVIVQ